MDIHVDIRGFLEIEALLWILGPGFTKLVIYHFKLTPLFLFLCQTTLPWVPADTKLSKLDTLRLATSYIAHLRDSLLTPAAAAAAAAAAAVTTRQTIGPQSPPVPLTNGTVSFCFIDSPASLHFQH